LLKVLRPFALLLFLCTIFISLTAQERDTRFMLPDTALPLQKKFTGLSPMKQPRARAFILPAALITYGFVAIGNEGLQRVDEDLYSNIQKNNPGFRSRLDDYLQYTPGAAVYILNAAGVKGRHNFRDRTFIYLLSNAFTLAFVRPVKNITKVPRPDTGSPNSFPSGHTTFAFAGAYFLHQEYKHRSNWYGVAGYSMATATGLLRMLNERHWFKDVVAGAGFGILSGQLAYLLYPKIKNWLFKDKTAGMKTALAY
jgi:membrane-associated phospholipid phosphatase